MSTERTSLIKDEEISANCLTAGEPAAYYIDRSGQLMLADEAVTDDQVYAEYKKAGKVFLVENVPTDSLVRICAVNQHPAELDPSTGLSRMHAVVAQMTAKGFTFEQQEGVFNTIKNEFRKCHRPLNGKSQKAAPVQVCNFRG